MSHNYDIHARGAPADPSRRDPVHRIAGARSCRRSRRRAGLTTISASGAISGRWLAQGESVSRFGNDLPRLYQQELIAGIGYKLATSASLYGGYGIVIDFRPNLPKRVEHRPYQQLNLSLGKAGGGTLSARTRIEERFVEGFEDMGVRVRQQVRYVHPLAGKLSAFGTAEFFFNLNDTDWGAHSGFDRWRIGGGLRHPVGRKLAFELGYLNQRTAKRGASDVTDHIVTTALAFSF
jgi:hypothetical protein